MFAIKNFNKNEKSNEQNNKFNIRVDVPLIYKILLIDRTTSTPRKTKNIIWANDNYKKINPITYAATAQIKPELITGIKGSLIMPRALKESDLKKNRTKNKAEVFTPTWIIKMQNDAADINYKHDSLEEYVRRKWLEITCGEAPYMATRYEMETGEPISLIERVGFIDRKLKKINYEITDKAEWQRLVELAYKSSYGFEWNGDSLLLARENLLYSYCDYYNDKWKEPPLYGLLESIAIIISYNVFQMDGLSYTIPLSEKKERVQQLQLSLFDLNGAHEKTEWIITPGKRVRIMNWDTNKMEFFDRGIKKHERKHGN